MPNATGAAKHVQAAVLDLWEQGPGIAGLFTNLDEVRAGGDTVEIPYFSSRFTVNRGENASPEAVGLSADSLSVDTEHFINIQVTSRQEKLVLGGGRFTSETARQMMADYTDDINIKCIEDILKATSASDHRNLDLSLTLTDKDTSRVMSSMIGQAGVTASDEKVWLASPAASVEIKSFANYSRFETAQVQTPGQFGLPRIGTLDGLPYIEHGLMPGDVQSTQLQSTISSSSVSSNVVTVTLPSADDASKWTVGQSVYTTGMTANVDVATPATITAISGATVSFALTAADGSNGAGTLYSASAMMFLILRKWAWFSSTGRPDVRLMGRENDAGNVLQAIGHTGFEHHTGAFRVLHLPLS